MSVVRVEYLAVGRDVTIDKLAHAVSGLGDAAVSGSGREQYRAYCDDKNDREITILTDSRIPQVGSVKAEQGKRLWGLYVTSVNASYEGTRCGLYCWLVTVNYGPKTTAAASESITEGNQELWSFSYSVDDEDWFVAADRNNKQNINTLGEWYTEPLNCPNGIVKFNYSFKSTGNPVADSRDYYNKINSTIMWGWAQPKTVKIDSITGSCTIREADREWTTNIVVSYKARGWDVYKANAGHYYKSGNNLYRVLNADGSVSDEPVLLNAQGGILANNQAPSFNVFQIYDTADLNQLGLPNPFTI